MWHNYSLYECNEGAKLVYIPKVKKLRCLLYYNWFWHTKVIIWQGGGVMWWICNILHILTLLTDFGIQQIINFDVDLMDSIVLACVLVSYCPFLAKTHFDRFYIRPSSPEQCSHNAIILVSALKYIGIDYDIQPNDLCSSNPISMILLVIHLYERMFAFKPEKTITFETVLNKTVNQQAS